MLGIYIRGKRRDIEDALKIISAFKVNCESNDYIRKRVLSSFENALNDEGDLFTVSLFNQDDDDTHGVFESILNAVFKNIPELAVAVMEDNEDIEYGTGHCVALLYWSPNEPNYKLEPNSQGERLKVLDSFPDEDWIPLSWRKAALGIIPPAARGEGRITLLGNWDKKECEILERALSDGGLQRESYYLSSPKGEEENMFDRTESGFTIHVGGPVDFGTVVEKLDEALIPYTRKHESSYRFLCSAMRKKKVADAH